MARTGNNSRIPAIGTYSGAATFAADLTELAGNVADEIGRQVPTSSALPGSGNWPGRLISAADTKILYEWTSSGWVAIAGPDLVGSGAVASGWTANKVSIRKTYSGRVHLEMNLTKSTATADADIPYTIGSGFYPPAGTITEFAGTSTAGGVGQACIVQVLSDGRVRVYSLGSGNRQIAFSASYMGA
jgi:hypothetical protein